MIVQEDDRVRVLEALKAKGPQTFVQLLEVMNMNKGNLSTFHEYLGAVLCTLVAQGKIEWGVEGHIHLCPVKTRFSCLCCNKEPTEGDGTGFMLCASCGRGIMGEYSGLKNSGHQLTKGQNVLVRMVVKGILPNLQVLLEPYDQTPAFPVLRVHRNMVCDYAPLEAKQSLNHIRARGWRVVSHQDIADDCDFMSGKDLGVRWVFGHLNGTVIMGEGPTDIDAFRQVNRKIDTFEHEESKLDESI